ncbi:uncharacterized protein [Amphiura filiformis]|uniref:uncharacterized protein n=1 Tax=Amphiura filiformis TaxID=82378 RepID=UPI003B225408
MDEGRVRQIRCSSVLAALCCLLLFGQATAHGRRDTFSVEQRAYPDVRGTQASKRSTSQTPYNGLDFITRGTLASKRNAVDVLGDSVRGNVATKRARSSRDLQRMLDSNTVRGNLAFKRSNQDTAYNSLSDHTFNRASGDFQNDMLEKLQNQIDKAQLDESERKQPDFEQEQDSNLPFLDALQQFQNKRVGNIFWPGDLRLQRRLYNQQHVMQSEQRDLQIDQDYPEDKRGGPFDWHTVRGSLELRRAKRSNDDDEFLEE